MPAYLIRAGESGPVKIGHARNVARRMAGFQTAHYERLTLLRTWPGGQPEEAALHRAFSDARMGGEWFRFSEAMLTADPAVLLALEATNCRQPERVAARVSVSPVLYAGGLMLAHYLAEHGIGIAQFGTRIGVPNKQTMWRYVRGGRFPPAKVLAAIEAETAGVVTASDFVRQQSKAAA